MAPTDTPHHTPEQGNHTQAHDEAEPLLGRPGDALQSPEAPLFRNLWLGTGFLAQAGAILLLALVWAAVFTNPLLPLFSPHPLLQSAGVFTLVQAILVLQPTNTGEAKVLGACAHASLNLLSFLMFVSGVTIIETNKEVSGSPHFHSLHGYLGVATAAVLLMQYIFGFLMWGVPSVFGGVDNAKALWKYHRWSGYALLLLVLVTVISAFDTAYNKNVLDIKLWALLVSVGLILVGIFPRIQLTKLGIHHA